MIKPVDLERHKKKQIERDEIAYRNNKTRP